MVDDTTIVIFYGNTVETLRVLPGWDWQNWEPTLCLTGKDQRGVAVWAKKVDIEG